MAEDANAGAIIHSMTRRCIGWDYRQRAIYQITLVQRDRRQPLLGWLEVSDGRGGWVMPAAARALMLAPDQIVARVVLTPLGEAILAHWKRIGDFTPEIKPLYCQIMPDHLHAILEVTRPMARPLGNAIGGFKTGCEKIFRKLALSAQDKKLALSAQDKQLALSAPGEMAGLAAPGEMAALAAAGEMAGLAAAGEMAALAAPGEQLGRLWAEGFQDSILFHDGQLNNMFNYLRDNARRLAIKLLFPDLFRVVGALRVNLRLGSPVAGASPASFASLGNRFLLDGPLLQVQVSRRDFGYRRVPKPGGGLKIARDEKGVPQIAFESPAFAEKCARLLAAAKHGAALISPCVSDGEREIARRALEARFKLVTLANKGFSKLQKPSGRYFDACADGRLLMLAPIAWPYVPGEKPMRREDALVLNRLAQALAGDGAAEINYHGVTFEHIEEAARRAVERV